MEFAKRELQKYGWKEGKGLGKHEMGMTKPIIPKLKFDTTGIGHDYSEEFTHKWWENVYDDAVKNVNITKNENEISVNVCDKNLEVTNKKIFIKRKKKSQLVHGRFFKTSTLQPDGSISDTGLSLPEATNVVQPHTATVSDEELFKLCGGRTAHKGARHGLKLNGKLARIEEQDKKLLEQFSGNQINKPPFYSVTEDKNGGHGQKNSALAECDVPSEVVTNMPGGKKKKKRRKKKEKYAEES